MKFDVVGMGGASSELASWQQIQDYTQRVEDCGYNGLWGSDHLWNLRDNLRDAHERFTVISALAMRFKKVRFGTSVIGNTYRHPVILAKLAASADVISDGRLDLGIGAGWTVPEHHAYGIPLPDFKTRMEMLDEALTVIRSLWTNERTTVAGKHYQLDNAPFEPKGAQQPHIHLVVGGNSPSLLRIAARHANEWNIGLGSPGFFTDKSAAFDAACAEVGRDPREIARSTLINVQIVDTEAEAVQRREAYIALEMERASRGQAQKVKWVGKNETLEQALLGMMLIGEKQYVIDGLGKLQDLGVSRVMVGTLEEGDMLERFAAEIIPAFQ